MRTADVTIDAMGAWEVWSCRIPDEIDDKDVEEYVRDNFGDLEKTFEDSGVTFYQITKVELL